MLAKLTVTLNSPEVLMSTITVMLTDNVFVTVSANCNEELLTVLSYKFHIKNI